MTNKQVSTTQPEAIDCTIKAAMLPEAGQSVHNLPRFGRIADYFARISDFFAAILLHFWSSGRAPGPLARPSKIVHGRNS
jgi:hypothetical protein